MRVLDLRERFAWMGVHSGYDLLCQQLGQTPGVTAESVWRWRGPRRPLVQVILNWVVRHCHGTPLYDASSAAAELRTWGRSAVRPYDLVHVLYAEENYALLARLHRLHRTPVVATAHQPPRWWRENAVDPYPLRHLNGIIVMSREQEAFFAQQLDCPVRFIPHGVDASFFAPPAEPVRAGDAKRFVFCGVWLRDLATLEAVVDAMVRHDPDTAFDLIMPPRSRDLPVLQRLAQRRQVCWHQGLTDEELRAVYGRALALVLPIHDCTANNALLEAMACGLPIVSNNVGGLPDYTTPEFADLLPPGDVDGFVACLRRLMNDPAQARARGAAARQHAVANLAWERIAVTTLDFYRESLAAA